MSPNRRLKIVIVLVILSTVSAFSFSSPVVAQPSPNSARRHARGALVKLVIDTDPGVDDAAALIWLLSQKTYPVKVIGIGTVVGNTTAVSAANKST